MELLNFGLTCVHLVPLKKRFQYLDMYSMTVFVIKTIMLKFVSVSDDQFVGKEERDGICK
jgi:hypothetical protein